MTYLYIYDELHIITPCTNSEESHEENLGYPRSRNDITDYVMIMEVSLFNKILKCYINYFDAFQFIVGNLMVTYHPTGYKRDPNKDDKVKPP